MILRSYELPPDDFESSDDDAFQWSAAPELESGERICEPLDAPRGSTFWPAALVIAAALTTALVLAQFPAATSALKQAASALTSGPVQDARTSPTLPRANLADTPASPVAAADPDAADPQPPAVAATGDAAVLPPAAAGEADAPGETASQASDPSADVEPLPKPVADPKDPNQKRALAAGLHPDISKALLARMTAADFNNARNVVEKALLQGGDSGVLFAPRTDGKSGLAFFEVKFVAGAAPGCHRYIVIITKDRWSTTAPPMERCGDELPKPKVVRNRA